MPPQPPRVLTDEQLAELGELLRSLASELAETIDRSADEAKPVDLDEPIGRLSRMDAISQRAISQAGRRQQAQHLVQVQQALADLERGEYGWCRACDEPIGYARLKARPNSTVCVKCQQSREQRR